MKDKAIEDAVNSIKNRISHVYNQGYEDGKESVQIDESTAYKAGLEAAWELARKLSNLGFNDTRKEIFGEKYGLSIDIIKNFSVDEVAAKIKEYEEKQKQADDEIKAFQSVTPQPKTGRWIGHSDESGKWYECDQCHTDWGGPVNYCPNCGAKMEGDKR